MKNTYIFLLVGSMILSGTLGGIIALNISMPQNNAIQKTTFLQNTKTTNITDLQNEITQVIKSQAPSIVNIIIKKDLDLYRSDPWGFFREKVGSVEKTIGGGSGFFITKEGLILTNKHVVSDKSAKYTVIDNLGNEFDASIVAYDTLTDLAVIKIDSPQKTFPPLTFVQTEEEINIGQFAIAVGNALGEFQNSVSFGIVSGKNRSIEAGDQNFSEELNGLLQTDVAINPGNSGGPLLNLEGKVMGINTAIAGNSQGVGFSIPLTQKRIDYIIESIQKYNVIKRPIIGIKFIGLTSEIAKKYNLPSTYGAYIPEENNVIGKNSSAQKAGLEAGDIILEINQTKITQQTPIQALLQNHIPGDKIELKVMKKTKEIQNISLTLSQS